MIQNILPEFEDRAKEVNTYFNFLEKLEKPKVRICFSEGSKDKFQNINPDVLKILKANGFLILYNLIESSIRDGIEALYQDIEKNNYTYDKLRNEIKDIWVKFRFKKKFSDTSNRETGRKIASQLIQEIIDNAIISLDKEAIPISGNLDARKVRELCGNHGISQNVHYRANNGLNLLLIKEQRNALAHGDRSFSDCGKDFTVNDLIIIKSESFIYIRSILRNIKKYVDQKDYELKN
jgi:hypothetical protein